MKKVSVVLVAAVVVGAAIGLVRVTTVAGGSDERSSATAPVTADPAVAAAESVRADLGRLPVSFVANRGRWDSRASWVASGSEATAYFVDGGVRWALAGAAEGDQPGWALDQALVGARAARPTASVAAGGIVSYFGGASDHAGLPTATELTLAQAWPGVDVVWSGTGGHIEATYRLAPGVDPSQVRVAWRGADGLAVTDAGRLSVSTPVRSFEEDAPVAFQEIDGSRVPVDVAFELDGADTYGFRLGSYDPSLPLVIDPTTLLYASFLGGSDFDLGTGIAVDGTGNAYVTGSTTSTAATFPETAGAFQAAYAGNADAFVAKVNPTGSALVYASFLGGSGSELAHGIAVDGAGHAYVTGETSSTAATFPETSGAFQAAKSDFLDAFVAKVNPSGSALVYASYLGGTGFDVGNGVAVDGAGNAYVVGQTDSKAATFPITPGAFQPANAGGLDAFVAKVNPSGSALAYSSFLGGSGEFDRGNAVALDGAGNAYVAGETDSPAATFPDTPGAFQPTNGGGIEDAFVAKVNPSGSALAYASFLGGSGDDRAFGIAVDGAGNAYVAGKATSTAATFPETSGAFQAASGGGDDAFVAKVNPSGSALVYAGFLGGGGADFAQGIAVDAAGNAYVTGQTASTAATFPDTPGNFQADNAGGADAFVAEVNATGSALVYATFLGGSSFDSGFAIAVDLAGSAYVAGVASSTAATFPDTPGVFQPANAGGMADAFVAKVGGAFPAGPCTQTLTGDVTGPFTVDAGQTLCVANARVIGPITVNAGGGLSVVGSQVSNGIVANSPASFSVCGSQVSGPSSIPGRGVVVTNSSVPVRIGDPSTGCAPNRVAGDVILTANSGGLVLGSTTVTRNVTVNDNSGATVVKANTVGNTLACSGNAPAPTNAGQANTAAAKSGQCAAL